MNTDRPCPSRQTVTALLFGTLPPEQEDDVNLHLEDCPACAAQARQIESEADPLLDALRQPAPPPAETSAPAPVSDQPEAFHLDGFRILNELGRGGMGVVYRAYQHRLNRLVAIKMILSGQLAGADERARFMMEGSLLAQLNHPNFVQVYEVGTVALSAGTLQPYLVLEFVDGGNLKARLAEKLLPFAEAARLVLVLARAMEVAHAQGIVHRDLKPANVLLARDGTLKISDFGLARELKASNSLTPTGLAVGTPAYMAPEQARGHANLGPATDVYALGAILYEVLTGKVPFDGNTPVEVLVQVMQQQPAPLAGQRAGLPRDLETICLKCLQKEPQARYRSAGELADDLQAWLEHRPIQARPVGHLERSVKWARRHPLPASLLVFLILSLLLGSAGSTYFGYTASEQAVATKKALAKEEEARRASDRRAAELQLVAGRRLATDGEVERGMFTLARGWEMTPTQETDLQRVFQRDLEAWASYLPRVRWYADAADATYVVMAGDEVVYATKNEVIARDAATGRMLGAPRKYAGKIVALSADGSRLCTQGFENDVSILRVFERATGKQIGVDIADKRGGDLWNQNRRNYYWMRFSPDGKLVLREFISQTLEERQVWDIASGAPVGPALTRANARLLQSDTGAPYWLLISDERIEVIDGRTGTVLGGADALPADVSRPPQLFPHAQVLQTLVGGKVKWWDCSGKKGPQPDWRLPGTSSGHAVSGDGRFLVSIFGSQRLCWQDLASRRFCIPTAAMDPGTLGECISPDARNCLYVRRSLHLKFVDFPRLMPAHVPGGGVDDKRFRALAPPEVRFSGAIFSADRKTALTYGAAHAHRSSYARLTSTIDNAPLGRPMTECDTHAAFSPSGRLIALATWDDTRADASPLMVRVYDAQTGEPRSRAWTVTSFMHTLAFSPDETHLAVGHVAGALLCNLVTGADSINLVQPGPISRVLFSPDGRRLALCSRSGWGSKAGTRIWDVEKAQPAGAFVPMQNAPLLVAEPGDAFRTIDLDTGRMRRWSFAKAAPDADLPVLADFPTVPRGNEIWTLRSDKQWLALGSRHGAIWQWNLATGQRLGPIAEFHQPCRSLEYAPDGSWLAASGEEGDVGLFDPLTGKQAGPLLAQGEPSVGMAFTPDGSELVTVSQDGRCIRWPMGKSQPMTASQWTLWLEAATGVRLDAETVLPLSVEEHQKRVEAARALSLPLALPGLPTSSWHAEQASSAEHTGQLNSARWHLDRWIAAAPQLWLPHARRARIHAFQGLTKEAQADLKRAASLSHNGELENWRRHQIAVAGVTGKSIPLIEAPLR